ncbi:MAG: response regulator transcription factor [Clostridia bacterium]|nr:response regulator transcription factor [Clostridia bacterium]
MESYNILVIDDVVEIIELIEIHLLSEGYGVYKAFNGPDGLKILESQKIHLVVLDIMMPGMDGLETCRLIRQKMNIPIIMLSAKSQDMDKILGLGMGADDYMIKPFNPMELVARVKSQLRRYLYLNTQKSQMFDENTISIKSLLINKKNHQVSVYDKEVSLTPTEYEILLLLASNPGTVFSTEEIFERVWKEKYFEANNTVMVHIWRLREKIEENPKEPKVIETIWGVGYKIEN